MPKEKPTPPEPITRIGVCGKCGQFDLLFKITGLPRYRCSTCYKLETGTRHWLERKEVTMNIKPGQQYLLHHVMPVILSGLKVEVITVEQDDVGVNVDVKLLEDPAPQRRKIAYHMGDILTVSAYQLTNLK